MLVPVVSNFVPAALHSAEMTSTPNGGAGVFARLAQLVKDHPLLAIASALGSIGTFAAGMAGVVGLFTNDGGGGSGGSTLSDAPAYEYARVSDNTGQISVDAPTAWARVEGNGWHPQGLRPIPPGKRIGPGLNATTNLAAWGVDLRTPGVFVGASRELRRSYSPDRLVRAYDFPNCDSTPGNTHASDALTGATVTWICPGAEWRLLAGIATASPDYLVYIQVKVVSTADEEAYERILETLELDLGA